MKMKKYILIIAAFTSAPFILASCDGKKADDVNGNAETSAAKPYPLDVCIVSGEKLGSMGDPHVFVYQGQEIKMCCDRCMPKFNKNPGNYLAKLKQGKSSNHDHSDHSGHSH